MSLINAICTNCGAHLKVESNKEAAICEYCGSAFIVEKAIKNYNFVNNNKINAEVVNIFGRNESDFVIRAGCLEKYNGVSTDVVVPNSVNRIYPSAFVRSGITSIVIPDSVKEIDQEAFCDCSKLKKIEMPNGIIKINSCLFKGCSSLETVVLPNTVIEICSEAFRDCVSLKSIVLPEHLNKIGFYAFYNCSSLTEITIPESVTTIECYDSLYERYAPAFGRCVNLSTIYVLSNEPKFSLGCFAGSIAYDDLVKKWKTNNLCSYCGGSFNFWGKKCKVCGKSKNY